MHRQLSSLLSAGGSPGKLAQLGEALGAAGIDIATIGGAEWRHFGPVTFIVKEDKGLAPDDQLAAFASVMQQVQFPWIALRTVEVRLADEPGELGRACRELGNQDINIYSLVVLDTPGNKADVGLGIRPSQARAAVAALRAASFHVEIRPHPDDPDDDGTVDPPPWWDRWDDRTEHLLDGAWEDTGIADNDPIWWDPDA
jgi:hypothetical protein